MAVRRADFSDLTGCSVILMTAGINERIGGATDRNDIEGKSFSRPMQKSTRISFPISWPLRRMRSSLSLQTDQTRSPISPALMLDTRRVFVAGTFLDSLRFRTHLARHFSVNPCSADGAVFGEHGTASVLLWSSAWIADARHDNITMIEGIVASQYRIEIVSARLAEAVLRDEKVYSSRIVPSSGIWSQPPAAIGDRRSWRRARSHAADERGRGSGIACKRGTYRRCICPLDAVEHR